MEQEIEATPTKRSGQTFTRDAERAVVSPRFDVGSIRKAQPAVPLQKISVGGRPPRTLLLLAAFAALVGVVAGVVGASIYQRRERTRQATEAGVQAAPAASAEAQASANEGESTAPSAGGESAAGADAGTEPAGVESASGDEAAAAEDVSASRGDAEGDHAALRGALGEWVDATNARDIRRQMSLYDARLDSYYLSRNARAADVRAEKERVYGRAGRIAVEADAPHISLSPDGRTATMRFRKRYRIAGGGQDRRGQVVQELRWRKTDEGWRITSERDLRVLN